MRRSARRSASCSWRAPWRSTRSGGRSRRGSRSRACSTSTTPPTSRACARRSATGTRSGSSACWPRRSRCAWPPTPTRRAALRTLSLVSLVVLLVTLGLTYSRGGILSLLIALAVLVAIGPDRLRLARLRRPRRRGRRPRLRRGRRARRPDHRRAHAARRARTTGCSCSRALVLGGGRGGGRGTAADAQRRPARAGRAPGGAVSARARASRRRARPLLVARRRAGGLRGRRRPARSTAQWEDFTSVKQDRQTDPARVLRSNSGNRWVWWREAVGRVLRRAAPRLGRRLVPARAPALPRRRARRAPAAQRPAPVPGRDGRRRRAARARRARPARAGRRSRGCGSRPGASAATWRRSPCAALAWGIHMWFDWDADIPGVTLPLLVFLGVLAARPPGAPDAVEAVRARTDARAPAGPRAAGLLAGRARAGGARRVGVPAVARRRQGGRGHRAGRRRRRARRSPRPPSARTRRCSSTRSRSSRSRPRSRSRRSAAATPRSRTCSRRRSSASPRIRTCGCAPTWSSTSSTTRPRGSRR